MPVIVNKASDIKAKARRRKAKAKDLGVSRLRPYFLALRPRPRTNITVLNFHFVLKGENILLTTAVNYE